MRSKENMLFCLGSIPNGIHWEGKLSSPFGNVRLFLFLVVVGNIRQKEFGHLLSHYFVEGQWTLQVPCFNCVNFLRHFLIENNNNNSKRQSAKKRATQKNQRRTKGRRCKKRRTKKKKSEVLASFESLCWVASLLAWTRPRTSLGRRHILAWDYFSVLQFLK